MTAELSALQLAWASLAAAIEAAIEVVEGVEGPPQTLTKTVARLCREADEAEARLRAAKIWPGPALLADLTPKVCDILMELTGKRWDYLHVPVKPMARIWQKDGPTYELSIDDMIKPRYARVHTLWSSSGKTSWGDTAYAECLVNSSARNPYAQILLTRGADKIAKLISGDIDPRATTLWPLISKKLEEKEDAKDRQAALATEIAERLGDHHVFMTPEGRIRSRFATTTAPYISWELTIDRHGLATFHGEARDVDANHPLLTALVAT